MESNVFISIRVNPGAFNGVQVLSHMGIDIHHPPNLTIDWLINDDFLLADYLIVLTDIPLLLDVFFGDSA